MGERPRIKMIGSRIATVDTRCVKPPVLSTEGSRNPVYKDPRYQEWRARVIHRAGERCQRVGCGRKEPRMFADHIVEVEDDPSKAFDPTNGQCLCGSCHTLKTNEARAARHAR